MNPLMNLLKKEGKNLYKLLTLLTILNKLSYMLNLKRIIRTLIMKALEGLLTVEFQRIKASGK